MLDVFLYGLYYSILVHINQWVPSKLQQALAERRLISSIRQAYETVPYYKKKYDQAGVDMDSIRTLEDLKKIPLLLKEEVLEQFPDGIVARGVDLDKCHYSATTGSKGKSLPFIHSTATQIFYLMTQCRFLTMVGYRPWHKFAYIKYTAVDAPTYGPLFRQIHISSISPVEEQIAQLKSEKPHVLVGYASIILEIAQTISEADLKEIKLKFISVNSELSSVSQRKFISQVFGCPVYDEYSTEETWMIASQCRKYSYHINTDNVWVEFLDKDGNDVPVGSIGEMVLTTLRSPAMPFVRYRIGDMGRLSKHKCSCHVGFPLLESFEGRADDSFILPDGRFVSSLKLLNTFSIYITKYLHLLEEFKIIQKEKGLVVIQIVKGKAFNDDHLQELVRSLGDILGNSVKITVEFVDSIPTGDSIKRKAIESWVK